MRLPFRGRKQHNRIISESDSGAGETLAYALYPNGTMAAVKTTPYFNYAQYYSQFGNGALTGTPEGYAYASVVSVWAFRCIELRAQALNRFGKRVIDKRSGKPIEDHPLLVAMNRAPVPVIKRLEWSRMIWGETFLYPRKNAHGYYSDVTWLNNIAMTVDTAPGYVSGYIYQPLHGGRVTTFTPEQIVFMKTDNPFDDLRGLSRFETALEEIGIDTEIGRTMRAFYANDTKTGLMFLMENDLNDAQAKFWMDFFRANYQGPKNAGKPMLLPKNVKDIKEIQRAPIDADIANRENARRNVAAAFGVPLSIAGAWDDATYQSLPEQRKSFYEETMIPEGDEVADEINHLLLPYFDDTEKVRFEFDYSTIKALTENQSEKETALNQRLISGGITLNQYLQTLGYAAVPTGDVYYVPSSVIPTKPEDLGKPRPQAPTPFGGSFPMQAQTEAITSPEINALFMREHAHAQATAEDELGAWERKASKKGAADALKFSCVHLDTEIQALVRDGLVKAQSRGAVLDVFDHARAHLDAKKKSEASEQREAVLGVTPEEYQAYWGRFDQLRSEVGDDWLTLYMEKTYAQIASQIDGALMLSDIDFALDTYRDELAATWLGTEGEPGVLTAIILAGMAAGNDALIANKPVAPLRQAGLDVALDIDWSLLSKQAYDYARTYIYNLIKGLDATTRQQVQLAISDWIQTGAPLSDLQVSIEAIFHNPVRAQMIAETESTRAYFEGSTARWQNVGVTQARWRTVNDGLVCPLCDTLNNTIGDLQNGWQGGVKPPRHPGCRCFASPVLPDTLT